MYGSERTAVDVGPAVVVVFVVAVAVGVEPTVLILYEIPVDGHEPADGASEKS